MDRPETRGHRNSHQPGATNENQTHSPQHDIAFFLLPKPLHPPSTQPPSSVPNSPERSQSTPSKMASTTPTRLSPRRLATSRGRRFTDDQPAAPDTCMSMPMLHCPPFPPLPPSRRQKRPGDHAVADKPDFSAFSWDPARPAATCGGAVAVAPVSPRTVAAAPGPVGAAAALSDAAAGEAQRGTGSEYRRGATRQFGW